MAGIPVSGSVIGSAARGMLGLAGRALGATASVAIKGAGAGISATGRGMKNAASSGLGVAKSAVMATGKQLTDKGNRVQFTASTAQVGKNIADLATNRSKAYVSKSMYDGKKVFHDREMGFSGIAKTAIAGAFLYSGMKDMNNKINAENMGQIDSRRRTNTPDLESMIAGSKNPVGPLSGGADGSLVFALHNNR